MQSHAHAHPIKTRRRDDDLRTTVERVVAYRAECPDCEWRGQSRPSWAMARHDACEHVCEVA